MRHAITKLSHIHYVANDSARKVVLQLGERPDSIWLIGSPEVDIMLGDSLPSPESVKSYYEIPFDQFAILAFHPITTELSDLQHQIDQLCEAIVLSGANFVAVYPNNDQGSSVILERIMRLRTLPTVRLIPSLRFEAFQTLLKHARFIIGNSSSGVREAGVHGTPCINIGSRQSHRANGPNIVNTDPNRDDILRAISIVTSMPRAQSMSFGDGQSSRRFIDSLLGDQLWRTSLQKVFHRT
jgi:UDP-N-acetylglucosamine 2-epimerase (hydrolysing)